MRRRSWTSHIVQLLAADTWGAVVWYPSSDEPTWEPLVAWALTEEVKATADGEMVDDEDAWERHFPTRRSRDVEGVLLIEDRPTLVSRAYDEVYDVYVLGYTRASDYKLAEWQGAVQHYRDSRTRIEVASLESAVAFVREHPGTTQSQLIDYLDDKPGVSGSAFNRAVEAKPEALVHRRRANPAAANGWDWCWWVAEDAPAQDGE